MHDLGWCLNAIVGLFIVIGQFANIIGCCITGRWGWK